MANFWYIVEAMDKLDLVKNDDNEDQLTPFKYSLSVCIFEIDPDPYISPRVGTNSGNLNVPLFLGKMDYWLLKGLDGGANQKANKSESGGNLLIIIFALISPERPIFVLDLAIVTIYSRDNDKKHHYS